MHVLVPMDDSPLAKAAFEEVITVFPAPRVTVLHVIDYIEQQYGIRMIVPKAKLEERGQEQAEHIFDWARDRVADTDVGLETATRVGKPATQIVEYAKANDVDLVVMGSHGRSAISKLILGSVAEGVLRRSPTPVTIVR